MKIVGIVVLVLVIVVAVVGYMIFGGRGDKMEKTGAAMDNAVGFTKDLAGQAVEKTGEAMAKAGAALEKTGENMKK